MKLNTLLVSAVAAAVLSACSIDTEDCNKVDQDSIYQDLSASYDKGTDRTTVSAQFRFGGSTGTTLKMVENCAINHDSITLSEQSLLGTSYSGSKSGLVTSHTFTFTDNNGKTFTNTLTITAVEISSPPTTISRSAPGSVAFTGGGLAADESAGATLSQTHSDGSSTMSFFNQGQTGQTSVTLSSGSMMDGFTNGSATLDLTRSKTGDLTQVTSEGGYGSASYTTADVTVTLTD